MGSVYEEITRLETAKADIETAIEGCGVNVPDTKLISDYALYIRQIPSAVFSDLDVGPFGGEDMYIKTIELKDGLITATTGGLVSSASSGLVPKVINTNTATIESAYYVLASANGSASPSWYKLPTNVFKNDNTTYTFTSGTAGNFTVTPSGGTAQTVNIGKPSTAGYADTAGSVAWENVSGRPTSLPANGGNADTVDGYHASSFMHFLHDGGNYINASFLDNTLSTLANTYYIEFWDSAGGWFNSAWGKVLATTGFVKSGSSDSYVLLGGGGHKAESSLSVNYASSAGNADTLNGYHANSAGNKPWGTIPVVNTSGWMEIGKHLEFHFDNTTGSDFSTALMCTGNHSNVVNLPSASGTLALTSLIPTSLPANGGTANYINYTSRASKGNGYAQFCQYSGASNNPHDDWYSHIIMNHPNSAGYYTEIAACFHSDSVYFRKQSNGSTTDWKKFAWTSDIPTVSNSNGYVPRFVSFPDYMHFGSSTDTYDYLKNIVKWVYDNANYGNKTYLMGVGHPNSLGMMNIQLYGTDGKNSEGYPKYCSGTFLNLGDSAFEIFGTVDYNYYRYRLSVDGHGHRITKLHRRDASDDYSLQHHWTGSYWYLRGYYGDNYHAGVQVDYANSAGSVAWANVTGKPTIPTVTNYYWADIKVSDQSNTSTSPTFAYPTSIYSQFTNGSEIIGYIGRGGGDDNLYFGNYKNANINIFTDNNLSNSIYLKTGGNVGIGTISPAYRLDVVGSGKFSTALNLNNQRFNYGLAYYNDATGTVTGTIVIILPNGWNSSMNTYEIDLYEYNSHEEAVDNKQHSKIIISGYNYSGGYWANYGYQQLGSYNKGVRLGYNGSKCCILLGTTTTTWIYPQVHLSRVITGYSNQTTWSTGYSISISTNESWYSEIVSLSRTRQRFDDVVANNFRGNLVGNASYATSAGSAGYASTANMISHSTYYYSGNVMKNSTSSDTIFGTTATANYLFPSFMEAHPLFNNYADVINFTGYCMWGGTQLATEYNAINPRVAIRKYNQSRADWGDWTEFITSANISSQSVIYANSAGSAGYADSAGTASKVTCTEAFGDTPRPIVGIVNNLLYYTNKVNIRWDNGNVTAPTFTGRLIGSADQVDGYHISVVNSLPSPKDNNTIYILV